MSKNNPITFYDALRKLGMDESSVGIRFVSEKENERDNPDIYLALEQAVKFNATAVYFRFYDSGRPPQPQVYIYDRLELKDFDVSDADIHHRLWNAGIVPFCFIFRASKVLVYNCSKKPEYDDKSKKFITDEYETIDLLVGAKEEIDLYNARKFDSGLFWESEPGKRFDSNNGAYQQLLEQLKNVKFRIISEVGAEHSSRVKRLLMMLVLIKYLEERKGDDGNGALIPSKFYSKFNPIDPTLEGVLSNPETFIAVLNELSNKESFNGHIFYLNEGEKQVLLEGKIDLGLLQHFVKGEIEILIEGKYGYGQLSFWRLYEFDYLPIELISHIYEDFLADENGEKKKGVVYTPPYLVQLLIDQCMPLNDPQKDFRVLDPACGSGIFLVGAYKRMIQWWRYENQWKRPDKEDIKELKHILKNSIYGCDIENEAVTLTYFSLSLALLDSLSPKEIWGNVHFENLVGVNLIQGDFFKSIFEEKFKIKFNLVIGNPPFKSDLTDWAEKVDTKERGITNRPALPDNQIALLFLEQSLKLLAEGGNSCLILPSGPILYNASSLDFRKYFFERYWFKRFFDFTPLRTKLFVGSSSDAKPAVVALEVENREPQGRSCSHFIFRRTKASGEKIDFEIDHYDIHEVVYNTALNNERVWQSNFMGGGRLHNLLDKISMQRTLGDYLDEKVVNNDWKSAVGWKISKEKGIKRVNELSLIKQRTMEEEAEFNKLEEKYKADWITGHNYVKTVDFTEAGIEKIEQCNIKYFAYPRLINKEIFQPPHLLIKEQAGIHSIPIEYREDYLTFKDSVIGIHAPDSDKYLLKRIEKRFKNNASYSALLWLLSSKIITNREGVVVKQDIESLPFTEQEIEFDPIEEILLSDISTYYSEFRKTGEKSKVLEQPSDKDLEVFGELFCRILNSVYDDFKPLKPIVGNDFISYPFVLGDKPEVDIPQNIDGMEVKLNSLINNKQGYNLWVKRIVKVYNKNVIFLYKPNQKRYWLRSIAIRDADETFLELYKQEK